MKFCSFYLFLYFIFIFNLSNTVAEEAYSWIDSSGKTVYGSAPPENARAVKHLKTDKYSKYSSKLEKPKKFVDSLKKESVRKNRKSKVNQRKPQVRTFSSDKVKYLKTESVSFEVDFYNNVTNCSAIIKNESGIKVDEVSVTFKFYDGSLIPASGSFSINPGESEVYSIPDLLLPLTLSKGDTPENDKLITKPDVIIHRK